MASNLSAAFLLLFSIYSWIDGWYIGDLLEKGKLMLTYIRTVGLMVGA